MKKLFITLSAIPLSIAKPLTKLNRYFYSNVFNKYGTGKGKEKHRIYIPLDSLKPVDSNSVVVPEIVEQEVDAAGFYIDNYILGIAKSKKDNGKRSIRIGKILESLEAKQAFDNDTQRKTSKLKEDEMLVVISRHPYDIAGMSFDRGWKSCMGLNSDSGKSHVENDIKYGTIVAYLVKNSDRGIRKPIARISIKPFFNKNKTMILVPIRTYGEAHPNFNKIVHKFCDWADGDAEDGIYQIHEKLYAGDLKYYGKGKISFARLSNSVKFDVMQSTTNLAYVKRGCDEESSGIFDNENLDGTTWEYIYKSIEKSVKAGSLKFARAAVRSGCHADFKLRILKLNPTLMDYFEGSVTSIKMLEAVWKNTKNSIVLAENKRVFSFVDYAIKSDNEALFHKLVDAYEFHDTEKISVNDFKLLRSILVPEKFSWFSKFPMLEKFDDESVYEIVEGIGLTGNDALQFIIKFGSLTNFKGVLKEFGALKAFNQNKTEKMLVLIAKAGLLTSKIVEAAVDSLCIGIYSIKYCMEFLSAKQICGLVRMRPNLDRFFAESADNILLEALAVAGVDSYLLVDRISNSSITLLRKILKNKGNLSSALLKSFSRNKDPAIVKLASDVQTTKTK